MEIQPSKTMCYVRVTGTGHFADNGNQAPDASELSLTIFNGKKCKQTIKAHDHGLRDDPGSSGASLKHPGPHEKRTIFLQYIILVPKSANHLLSKV